MGKIAINNEIFGSEYASDIKYDNTNSKAESENIQDVIDEIFENGVGGSSSNNIYIGTNLEENPDATLFIKTDEEYEGPSITNNNKSNYHKYSTEEQIVGEWINGRKIYEKSAYFEGNLNSGNRINISYAIDDFEEMIDIKGSFSHRVENKWWFHGNIGEPLYNRSWGLVYSSDEKSICICGNSTTSSDPYKICVTFRYLKTTD